MTKAVGIALVLPAALALAACSAAQPAWVKAGYDTKKDGAVKRIAIAAWAPAEKQKLAELLAKVTEDRIKLRLNYLVYRAGPMDRGWSEHCGPGCAAAASNTEDNISNTPAPAANEPAPGEAAPAVAAETSTNALAAVQAAAVAMASPAEVNPEAPPADAVATTTPAEESVRPVQGVLAIRALSAEVVAGEAMLELVAELYDCATGALLWRVVGSQGNESANEDLAALTKSYIDNLGDAVKPYAAPAFLVLRDMLDLLPDVTLKDAEVMEKIELD
jgi:hypothetical protein